MSRRKIYIIAVSHTTDGIGAIIKHTISHIIYANQNNLIPIVDLKHYKNPYFKDGREYRDNVWEYFFDQPYNISIDDIRDDDDVTMSYNTSVTNQYCSFPVSKLPIYPERWSTTKYPIISEYKKYMIFNKEMQTFFQDQYAKIINNQDNILGILCRGTDYFSLKPYCHPIQPKPQDVIKKVKQLIKEKNIEKIYLATEDANIYKMFSEQFGNMMIENNQFKYQTIPAHKYLSQVKINRSNHHYNLAKEYLLSLYILSKCKYFIGGRTCGTSIVYIMTKGFEYEYIWNIGYFDLSYKLREKILQRFNFTQRSN